MLRNFPLEQQFSIVFFHFFHTILNKLQTSAIHADVCTFHENGNKMASNVKMIQNKLPTFSYFSW